VPARLHGIAGGRLAKFLQARPVPRPDRNWPRYARNVLSRSTSGVTRAPFLARAATLTGLFFTACADTRVGEPTSVTEPVHASAASSTDVLAARTFTAVAPTIRLARPHLSGLREPADRADFDRVRDCFAKGDYVSARQVLSAWRTRKPWLKVLHDRHLRESLERSFDHLLSGRDGPFNHALIADSLGLHGLAFESYTDALATVAEPGFVSRSGFCAGVVRCAIAAGRSQAALEYFDLAIASASASESVWRLSLERLHDTYRHLLQHPNDAPVQLRFAASFWWIDPPYRSPIPAVVTALQELVDDDTVELPPPLRAQIYAQLIQLETPPEQQRDPFEFPYRLEHGAAPRDMERALHWALRLATECSDEAIRAGIPAALDEHATQLERREPRRLALWRASGLLADAGAVRSAARMLELIDPTADEIRTAGQAPIYGLGHFDFDRISHLYECAGDIERAIATQIRAGETLRWRCVRDFEARHDRDDAVRLERLQRLLASR
jgi:hypothetical protein